MTLAMTGAIGRISRQFKQKGVWATVRFLFSRVFRSQKHLVFEAWLTEPLMAAAPDADHRLLELGPENLDAHLDSRLEEFLGGQEAFESLEGVRKGDRLFVIANGDEYLHRGYILFKTRQKRIIGETRDAPLIASCRTAAQARGRGLYRRALQEELRYLKSLGHERAIIETDPENIASRAGIVAAGFRSGWEARVWIVLNKVVVQRILRQSHSRWRVFFV